MGDLGAYHAQRFLDCDLKPGVRRALGSLMRAAAALTTHANYESTIHHDGPIANHMNSSPEIACAPAVRAAVLNRIRGMCANHEEMQSQKLALVGCAELYLHRFLATTNTWALCTRTQGWLHMASGLRALSLHHGLRLKRWRKPPHYVLNAAL